MNRGAQNCKALLTRAANLLEEDASASYEACEGVDGPWSCPDCPSRNCAARKSYTARKKCAAQLRAAAATKQKATRNPYDLDGKADFPGD